MTKPKEPKTHFEQVPLEIVKKIAAEDIPDGETSGTDGASEPPARERSAFRRPKAGTGIERL
jgi:hypothetical protein